MGVTTALRQALKQDFFHLVEGLGFVRDTRLQPQATVYRRRAGDVVQSFELRWDKYGRPRFALQFGTCPREGLDIRGEHHDADQVLPGWCEDTGTLQPGRGAGHGAWFRQDASVLQRLL